jgi:hypothetical protein
MTAADATSKRAFRAFICSVCGGECRYRTSHLTGRNVCPCPSCGWIPQEPTQVRRAQLHFVVAAAAAVVLGGLFVAAFLGLGIPTWCLIAGIAGLACVVLQGAIAVWNPNRNLEKNVSVAEGLVSRGIIRDISRPRRKPTRPSGPTHGLGWGRTGLIATAALCVIAMVSAEVARKHQGWIFNRELGVLGPGDSFTVTFENLTPSIGGRWTGEPLDPQIVLTEQHKSAIEGLTSATHTQIWREEINSSMSDQVFAPWSTVSLPARDELSWRRLTLEIRLDATFPEHRGGDVFDNATKKFRKTLDVTLSAPGARHRYSQIWRIGGLGGAIAFLLANLALAADRTGSTGSTA